MTKTPISLQDLRRSLYVKAKAEPTWRFWGLYVHVCKMETLREAYQMTKSNDGAPGIDGVTFEAIEESGEEGFLKQLRDELVSNTYRPMRARKKEIPKDGNKVRILSIPAIRDRAGADREPRRLRPCGSLAGASSSNLPTPSRVVRRRSRFLQRRQCAALPAGRGGRGVHPAAGRKEDCGAGSPGAQPSIQESSTIPSRH